MYTTYYGIEKFFLCSGVHPIFSNSLILPVLHQLSMEAPRNEDDRWWKPIKIPSIQVNKKTVICHLPSSPTSFRISSNLTLDEDRALVAPASLPDWISLQIGNTKVTLMFYKFHLKLILIFVSNDYLKKKYLHSWW